MARQEKQKTSLLMQDKFFYTLLTVTLVLLVVAFYFAFGMTEQDVTGQDDNTGITDVDNQENTEGENVDPALQQNGDTPNVGEDQQTEAPVSNLPADDPTEGMDNNLDNNQLEAQITFIVPCDGQVIKDYSGTSPVFSETLQDWRLHTGVDIRTENSENVFAAADGVVDDVYKDGLMGVSILIKHADGIYTLYQGLEENVKVLQRMEVKQGDIIGKTGLTAAEEEAEGRHLHFEIIMDGANADPHEYMSLQNQQ
jgi:murein DD-endopeptidase MepM/ murein hydrolase activator NlpD